MTTPIERTVRAPESDAASRAADPALLTWSHGHSHNTGMKTIAAGKFKAVCLQTLDDVALHRTSIVITKRGRPVAKLVPITTTTRARSLVGSIVADTGDPFTTGETWDAGRS
jgi:antitoxin (DNA-binding transcriptional repressor) of toxin-antitoxin stability system